MSVIYYLSVWFQAAKDDSAMHAGISTLPLVLSLVVMSIVAAIFTQKSGYYVPAMLLSPVLCSIGAGLLAPSRPAQGTTPGLATRFFMALVLAVASRLRICPLRTFCRALTSLSVWP